MSKGRNTTRISVRIPDDVLELLRKTAEQKGLGYTVLARHLIQRGLGLKLK